MVKKIKSADIKLWFILFCAINIVFAYYQLSFFWGNHDWDWVKGTTQILSLNTGMFEGRYAKFILNVALFGGQILPLLNSMIAFALLAAGGVMLVNYWQIKSSVTRLYTSLLAVLCPFILGWLYFPINILGNFSAVALVIGGLQLNENKNKPAKIISIICFLLALGVYPSVIEMIIICFCFRYILTSKENIKNILKKAAIPFFALILFKLLLWGLGNINLIVADYYNLKTVSLLELIRRTPEMAILSFNQLIITIPFMPLMLKIFGGIIIFLAIINIKSAKVLGLWIVALLATVLSTWLTGTPEETAYMPRVNFYGINFLYAGALTVLLSKKGWQRNIGLLLGTGLIWMFITENAYAQKVWNFGKIAEEQQISRISSRVIEKEDFKQRTAVVAGELSLRPRYYHDSYQRESAYLLNKPFMVRHIPSGIFNFYEASPLFYGNSQIAELSPQMYQFLKQTTRTYPADDGLFIDDKYVVILLTPEGIMAIKSQLPY